MNNSPPPYNPPPQTPPPKGGGVSRSAAGKHIKYAQHTATKTDIKHARALRHKMPRAERILWKKLRELPPEYSLTFRRQHPVHPYIIDFACIKMKLAIELDGMSHDDRQARDQKRDLYLFHKGYVTLRFTNDELMANADGVIETIIREAKKLERGKALPLWGEGWVGGQCRQF